MDTDPGKSDTARPVCERCIAAEAALLAAQQERERMQLDLDFYRKLNPTAKEWAERAELAEATLTRLREALRWYAAGSVDSGARARRALAQDAGAPTTPMEPWPNHWPEWTRQYEETAERLHAARDFGAADEIATLVQGLVQYEREAAQDADGTDIT